MNNRPTILPPVPIRAGLSALWALKPGVCFLNHGSFRAVPIVVKQAQDFCRERIEAEPVEMIGRRSESILNRAKVCVGERFGMQPENFGFVTNATEGVNAVLQSLRLKPGDELVTTNHVYHAVRQAMRSIAAKSGATCREISIPIPVESAEQIRDLVVGGLTQRTRLLVVDQVTSPTALVFPVEQIITGCRARGIDVLVDGAHVPGMLPLNVEKLGATYYVGNLHKWVCAPRGSAFLWVAAHKADQVHPTTISHYLGEGFAKEFNWQGTRDFSAWFTIPAALDFLNQIGFDQMMSHNHQLAVWAHQMLVRHWKVEPISPWDGSLLGCMATIALPSPLDEVEGGDFQRLQERLYHEFQIEVPLMRWGDRTFLRVSGQIYNTSADYERLAETVRKIL